jgi:hypothetical protein
MYCYLTTVYTYTKSDAIKVPLLTVQQLTLTAHLPLTEIRRFIRVASRSSATGVVYVFCIIYIHSRLHHGEFRFSILHGERWDNDFGNESCMGGNQEEGRRNRGNLQPRLPKITH